MSNKSRRVLVTGGCGFIGSYLVDIIAGKGHDCTVVDSMVHQDYSHSAHLANTVKIQKVSILDRDALEAVFLNNRPQDVYHLAAHHFIPYCESHPVSAMETNILGTQNVADLSAKHGVEKLFLASTAAVYGVGDAPHVESEMADPVDIYGLTKYAAERIVWFLSRKSDVKVRVGRYFNAAGRRETNPHILPEIVKQLIATRGKPTLRLGNIFPKRDYIHAADLAEASYTVLTAGSDESYDVVNIGSGKEFSVSEMIEMFSEALGQPIEVQTQTDKLRKVDRAHLCADNRKLAEIYGWSPRFELKDVVRDLVQLIRVDHSVRDDLAQAALARPTDFRAGQDLPVAAVK